MGEAPYHLWFGSGLYIVVDRMCLTFNIRLLDFARAKRPFYLFLSRDNSLPRLLEQSTSDCIFLIILSIWPQFLNKNGGMLMKCSCLLQTFLRGEGKHPRKDGLIRKDDENATIFLRSSYTWFSTFEYSRAPPRFPKLSESLYLDHYA